MSLAEGIVAGLIFVSSWAFERFPAFGDVWHSQLNAWEKRAIIFGLSLLAAAGLTFGACVGFAFGGAVCLDLADQATWNQFVLTAFAAVGLYTTAHALVKS